jgi:hypothetical protein
MSVIAAGRSIGRGRPHGIHIATRMVDEQAGRFGIFVDNRVARALPWRDDLPARRGYESR